MIVRESQVYSPITLGPITADIGTEEADPHLDPRKEEGAEEKAVNVTELTEASQDLEKGAIPDSLTKESDKADKTK